jgi:two-component system, NtrC family, response regulator AtoC
VVQGVLVIDFGPESSRRVEDAARCAGARTRVVSVASLGPAISAGQRECVAVTGVRWLCAVDAEDLARVSLLREAGYRVIAHGDGSDGWPLAAQCEPLIAGAAQLLDSGAADFAEQLRVALAACIAIAREREEMRSRALAVGLSLGIVGVSVSLVDLLTSALRTAQLSDVPVLIEGETGTGKELLARALHQLDPRRREGPFIGVNCAAISPGLAESELFGHRRGAFTGADRNRKGLFRTAHGGVLFLDEIGELDLELQAKLLRVLQERRVLGVGEDREEDVDVRVIAATHRDLSDLVHSGRFRADLLFRLNAIVLQVPPLRERPEDLAPLVQHFIEKYASLYTTQPEVSAEFLSGLRRLSFEGNVRELENLMREVLLRKLDPAPLRLCDLPAPLIRHVHAAARAPDLSTVGAADPPEGTLLWLFEQHRWRYEECMGRCERLLIDAALRRAGGNQTRAARLLGVTPRTMYNKLHKRDSA